MVLILARHARSLFRERYAAEMYCSTTIYTRPVDSSAARCSYLLFAVWAALLLALHPLRNSPIALILAKASTLLGSRYWGSVEGLAPGELLKALTDEETDDKAMA